MNDAKPTFTRRGARWGLVAITTFAIVAAFTATISVQSAEAAPESKPDRVSPNVLVSITLGGTARGTTSTTYALMTAGDGTATHFQSGARVPIPSTTFNTSNSSGSSIVPVASFTYQHIGFELEIRARVIDEHRVMIEADIQSSRLAGAKTGSAGLDSPVVQFTSHDLRVVLNDKEPLRTALISGGESRYIEIKVEVQGD